MRFLKLLIKRSKSMIFLIIMLGLFSSVLNCGFLMIINSAVSDKPLPLFPGHAWVLFVVIMVSSLIVSKIFQTHMIRLTNNILFDFELDILNKLKHASFEDFEKLGNDKVYMAINDTKELARLPEVFMNGFNSLIIAICCIGYLFWISPIGAGSVLLIMIALFVFYLIRNIKIEKELNLQRDLQNVYYRLLDDLLSGFKELKMSIARNASLFNNHLVKNRTEGRDISIRSSIRYMDNELTGSYSWYIVLGITMFVLPAMFGLSAVKLTGFLITILYIIGPVAVLVTLMPTYTSVKISLQRLNVFDEILGSIGAASDPGANGLTTPAFDNIRFESVSYKYEDKENGQNFFLEPINLSINKGEVIFITGGNGSGKSTFGYLLTGLYKPLEGRIYLNDKEITDENYPYYCNEISAIFTNSHLFSENYDDFNLRDSNQKLNELIKVMDLSHVLKPGKEESVLDIKLSKGQQKRLAMIYALLEDKPVLVLDEWAAEQDPEFRAYFYTQMLPRLKEQGKTIIAITHDDDYYSCATRVIKFNFGKIVNG